MAIVFKKIADSWEDLDEESQKELFKSTDSNIPTTEELKTLGEFSCFTFTKDGDNQLFVSGVPSNQLVEQGVLMSTLSFAAINKVSLENQISGAGIVKIAIMNKDRAYFVYNSTSKVWQSISMDINDVFNLGMTVEQLESIPKDAWGILISDNEYIGFAYLLSESAETDIVKVDTLILNVDMAGKWKRAKHEVDYDYSYITNKVLLVDLLSNGDYKINYPLA